VIPEELSTKEITRIITVKISMTPVGATVPIELSTNISVTIVNKMYDWLANWNSNTEIGANSIATGQLFAGVKNTDGTVSGIYIGAPNTA